ncbi:MAG: ABC-F family ATP-binding cassette domain-containing protein [Myxococcales bacterium]|nr:ABC-F family ATP-binding cassette domain-containing protein [Myxococcales bacterium]
MNADDLHLHYGPRTIFDGATLAVEPRDRLGVVGPNGTGKSTLLKILAGQLTPDGGQITRAKGIRVGYLAQEHGDPGEGRLLESVLATAPGKDQVEARLHEVEAELHGTHDEEEQLALAQELADLTARLTALEEDFAPHRAQRILVGLGFSQDDFQRPVKEFSGGWRMRAALAALLFQQPDVLLLDEPTNHLDMPSVHWLSGFLKTVRHAVVLTCHDKGFLNAHVTRVASLELEGVRTFRGNYDAYLEQRELDLEHLERRIEKEAQRKKELEAFVERFKAKASKARQAQSKAKAIERLEADRVDIPQVRRPMRIEFPPCERAADPVIRVEGLRFGYTQVPLFEGLDLTVRRGDRIAIVGANGMGKTTLLRLIGGELTPDAGSIKLGRNAAMSYFAQHHAEDLVAGRSVLQEVWAAQPDMAQTRVRSILGSFLFSGDDVEKPVEVLSGGEKARVALARILAAPKNVLLMDEPTNHLDTESADKLTESLEAYDGTILFVSHNLDFARRLSTLVWDVSRGKVETYPGSLGDYLDHLGQLEVSLEASLGGGGAAAAVAEVVPDDKAARMAARQEKKAKEAEHRKTLGRLTREIEALEAQIARLEAEQAELEATLADPATHADSERSRKASLRYEKVKAALEAAMESWTEKEAEREGLGPA